MLCAEKGASAWSFSIEIVCRGLIRKSKFIGIGEIKLTGKDRNKATEEAAWETDGSSYCLDKWDQKQWNDCYAIDARPDKMTEI